MDKRLLSLCLASLVLLFGGCSQKQYFEPEDTVSHNLEINDLDSSIKSFHTSGATLENNSFISINGVSKVTLDEGFKFLNQNDGVILSSNDDGILQVKFDEETKQEVQFEKNIVSATIVDELIAFILIDNSFGLYDLKEKRIVLREYQKLSILNNVKIASPIFLKSLVLFPTLDGKVMIVDKDKKALYKTINLDPDGDINNIIYLDAIGNTLIAATNNKVFTFVGGRVTTITKDIKSIAVSEESIFIATLDGTIIKYNQQLQEQASKKFKFANFFTLAFSNKLYALESQDYLLEFDENLENVIIYDFSFDEEQKIFTLKDRIYFEDNYITLK